MLVYRLKDCRIDEGEDIFGINFGRLLVAFYLILFVESETIKSSQIRGDKLFSNKWILYFNKIFLEKLNLHALLDFGKNGGHVFLKGVDRLIFFRL